MGNVIDNLVYYGLASVSKSLHSIHIITKNHYLFKKKRQYLLRIIPDSKLYSEIAAVAHSCLHPRKKSEDIASIKSYLAELIKEARKRGLASNTIAWGEKYLAYEYPFDLKAKKVVWNPNLSNLNSFKAIAKDRKTNRYAAKNKVDRALILSLLECAVEAPSSCNKQPWKFIIVDKKEQIDAVAKIKGQGFVRDFPIIIVCCFDKDAYIGIDSQMTPYLDCGAALMNLSNAGTAANLAVCWCNFTLKNVGSLKHKVLRSLLKIPNKIVPVSLVAIGVPLINLDKPPREPIGYYLKW